MKGIVFTEFMGYVESTMGLDTADRIIEAAGVESGGAYTAVSTYDYREMLALVEALADEANRPKDALLTAFGEHLFGRFTEINPGFIQGIDHPFPLLEQVENTIHVEVRKLYPDAELPAISTERPDAQTLHLIYHSRRPFADLAHGLIRGSVGHFHAPVLFREREDLNGHAPGTAARFTLVDTQEAAP